MIVDSSAVLAVFFAEPEAAEIAALLAASGPKRISAVNWLECAIKLDNAAPAAALELDAFLRRRASWWRRPRPRRRGRRGLPTGASARGGIRPG